MTGQPYCGAAPSAAELLSRWNLDPVLLLFLASLAALHASALINERTPIRSRTAGYYSAAWLLTLALFVSPLCALTSALFSVRVSHHVIMIAVDAPLFVLALPPRMRLLHIPPLATAALAGGHAIVVWYWHAPGPYAAALQSHAVFWAMEVSLLASALFLWAGLLSRRTSGAAIMLPLLATIIQMGLLGALITFARAPLYAPHFATTEMWGLSALADQQLAGLIMWVPAVIPYLAAALWRLSNLFNEAAPGHAA